MWQPGWLLNSAPAAEQLSDRSRLRESSGQCHGARLCDAREERVSTDELSVSPRAKPDGPLLTDSGYSLADIGVITGSAGATAGIVGAFVGGATLVRLGHLHALLVFGAMQALGLGFAELAKHNPRLVYVSLSGFGNLEASPYARWPAFAPIAEAMGGLYEPTKQPGQPPPVVVAGATKASCVSISDATSGATFSASACS